MEHNQKTVVYQSTNVYETLNTLSHKTKNIWLVFHGMGYLSRYFLKYFKTLNPEENYIIAPQAPSKYYLGTDFKHVGASWLTKESTGQEIENVLNYVTAVVKAEKLPADKRFIFFGFSQGVSIALRWLAKCRYNHDQLILYAGGIPNELNKNDLSFLTAKKSQIKIIYGDADIYLTEERLKVEAEKIKNLFGNKAQVINFKGEHEIKTEILEAIATEGYD
ncbi:MAG: esterase [Croceitalea sp.]|nr:esterase [Croceitalea sp.]